MFEVESQLCCNINVKELMDVNINVLQISNIDLLGMSAVSNIDIQEEMYRSNFDWFWHNKQ